MSAKTGEGVDTLFKDIALTLHESDEPSEDNSFSLHKKNRNYKKRAGDFYEDLNKTGAVDPNYV